MKEEKFPHTRNPFTGRDREWARGGGGELQSHGGECSNRGVGGKVEKFPHRGSVPTSTQQPERFVCLDWGWELRLRRWRSEPRERNGDGCVNTA